MADDRAISSMLGTGAIVFTGVVLMIIGAVLAASRRRAAGRRTARTEGVVIELVRAVSPDPVNPGLYRRVRYLVDGTPYVKDCTYGKTDYPTEVVGSQVTVAYDPYDPRDAAIVGDGELEFAGIHYGTPETFVFVGIVILVVAAVRALAR